MSTPVRYQYSQKTEFGRRNRTVVFSRKTEKGIAVVLVDAVVVPNDKTDTKLLFRVYDEGKIVYRSFVRSLALCVFTIVSSINA